MASLFLPIALAVGQGGLGFFSSLSGNQAVGRAAEAQMRSILLRRNDETRERSTQLQRDLDEVRNATAASGQTGQAFTALMAAIAGDAAEDTETIRQNAAAQVEAVRAGASASMSSPILALAGGALSGFTAGMGLNQAAQQAGGWSSILPFRKGTSEVPFYLRKP